MLKFSKDFNIMSSNNQFFDGNGVYHIDLKHFDKLNDIPLSPTAIQTTNPIIDNDNTRQQYITKQLHQNLPTKFIYFNSIIFILLSIVLVSMQAIMMGYNVALNQVGCGVWAAIYFIFNVTVDFMLGKKYM